MAIRIPAADLQPGDHFAWQGYPYEVVTANEGRHGTYVLAMRLQPQGIRLPEDTELDVERAV